MYRPTATHTAAAALGALLVLLACMAPSARGPAAAMASGFGRRLLGNKPLLVTARNVFYTGDGSRVGQLQGSKLTEAAALPAPKPAASGLWGGSLWEGRRRRLQSQPLMITAPSTLYTGEGAPGAQIEMRATRLTEAESASGLWAGSLYGSGPKAEPKPAVAKPAVTPAAVLAAGSKAAANATKAANATFAAANATAPVAAAAATAPAATAASGVPPPAPAGPSAPALSAAGVPVPATQLLPRRPISGYFTFSPDGKQSLIELPTPAASLVPYMPATPAGRRRK